uniref:Retrotransposon protein, putative, Ty1-copia subclass n=1 Tax=Tanacetum cinerariifolium TaxID=118510 RepID=A0A6L2NXB3_TANCI|nr:retrotransposon protein, putative, Ty1-copia subclass [Tanacetum cinerariifolium]
MKHFEHVGGKEGMVDNRYLNANYVLLTLRKLEETADTNKENAAEVVEQKEPDKEQITLEEYEKALEEKRKALMSHPNNNLKSEDDKSSYHDTSKDSQDYLSDDSSEDLINFLSSRDLQWQFPKQSHEEEPKPVPRKTEEEDPLPIDVLMKIEEEDPLSIDIVVEHLDHWAFKPSTHPLIAISMYPLKGVEATCALEVDAITLDLVKTKSSSPNKPSSLESSSSLDTLTTSTSVGRSGTSLDRARISRVQQEEVQSKNQKKKSRKAAKRNQGKGKPEMGYAHVQAPPFAPKPKNPPTPKMDNLVKDVSCHQCGEVGHWRRNFPIYLTELMKKKKLSQGASTSVFQTEVDNQLEKTTKSLRSDHGGKYMSQEFLDHLKEHGIISHQTPLYTPQHNGVFERRNRTLLDMVCSMMSQTTLPKSFWDYDLESAARVLNMFPTKKVDKTPEVWHEQALKMSYLKVWGCEALVKRDTLTKPNKLEPRAFKCIFVGHPKETMGYSFHYPHANKVFVPQNAEFFENDIIDQEANGSLENHEIIQEEDTETFSHVADIRAIMILIAIAAFYDYEIWQIDVKTAFLNGYLNEEVYMEQPEGLVSQKFPNRNITSQFQQNPDEFHSTAVKNILKCLRNTKDMFLVYGGAVDWKSTKQSIFATSSTDVEYIAAFDASKEAV